MTDPNAPAAEAALPESFESILDSMRSASKQCAGFADRISATLREPTNCHIAVAPATFLPATVSLSTAIACIQLRTKLDGPYDFNAGASAKLPSAIAAHAAAGGGEAVAWCQPDNPIAAEAFSWPGSARKSAHTMPLYTHPTAAPAAGEVNMDVTVRDGKWVGTYADWCRRNRPPAAVDVEKVRELVERWRADPYQLLGNCANELAALLPKGGE